MDKNQKSWILGGIIIILALLATYGLSSSFITGNAIVIDKETIKIGWIGPLSGENASYGENMKKSIELAFEDSNLNNVQIIFEDSKCNEKEALESSNKLIFIDEVIAVIGDHCTNAGNENAIGNGVPLILIQEKEDSEFKEKYRKFYGGEPSKLSIGAYYSFISLAQAIKDGKDTREEMRYYLEGLN